MTSAAMGRAACVAVAQDEVMLVVAADRVVGGAIP